MTAYSQQTFFDRIKNRQTHYEQRRSLYDDQRDVICELTRPDLVAGKLGELDEGAFQGSQIIEGTGPYSALVWQRGFQGNIVARKFNWFRHMMRESEYPRIRRMITFKGNDQVNQYLQAVDEHMRMVYKRSNFYDVMPHFILDGGTVGSPVMLREEYPLDRKIICKIPHYSQIYLDKDFFGRDNVLHVKWRLNALQAREFFENDDLPAAVKNHLDQASGCYEETEYLQVIYGAGDRIFDDLSEENKPIVNRKWMEYFICLDATEGNEKKTLKPKNRGPGYDNRPFSSWHMWRNWHEVYGRSMAWWAVHDIRGGNSMWEALFGEAELSIRPPVWAMGTMQGMLNMSPAGVMYARSDVEYDRPPQFMDRKTQYQVAMDFADRTKQSIERHFHVPLFMMINQMQMRQKQPVTAYQIFTMEAERHGQLAPEVEGYEQQVLGDNDTCFLEIEAEAGRLPEPPDILREWSDGIVDAEFIGPLSMAQQRDLSIKHIHQNLGAAEPIFNADQNTLNKIRWSKMLEYVMEEGNLPQGMLVPEDEYKALIETLEQRLAQAEMAEQAPKVTQAVKNLQGTSEEGSPIKLLTGTAA